MVEFLEKRLSDGQLFPISTLFNSKIWRIKSLYFLISFAFSWFIFRISTRLYKNFTTFVLSKKRHSLRWSEYLNWISQLIVLLNLTFFVKLLCQNLLALPRYVHFFLPIHLTLCLFTHFRSLLNNLLCPYIFSFWIGKNSLHFGLNPFNISKIICLIFRTISEFFQIWLWLLQIFKSFFRLYHHLLKIVTILFQVQVSAIFYYMSASTFQG